MITDALFTVLVCRRIVTMALHRLCLVVLFFAYTTTAGIKVTIELDKHHTHVEPDFLSVTLDCSILGPPKWKTFNFRFTYRSIPSVLLAIWGRAYGSSGFPVADPDISERRRPRNMKYKLPHLAAIYSMTIFYRPGGMVLDPLLGPVGI